MKAEKTIFLDFDGVLHPTLAAPADRFLLAPLLGEVVGRFKCEIVISSSWRFHYEIDQIRSMLPPELSSCVSGATGEAVIGRHARHREITSWLDLHGSRDWRALDDSAFEFPSPCLELIRCDGAKGITPAELDALAGWLAGDKN